jgi:hypothetical protein
MLLPCCQLRTHSSQTEGKIYHENIRADGRGIYREVAKENGKSGFFSSRLRDFAVNPLSDLANPSASVARDFVR